MNFSFIDKKSQVAECLEQWLRKPKGAVSRTDGFFFFFLFIILPHARNNFLRKFDVWVDVCVDAYALNLCKFTKTFFCHPGCSAFAYAIPFRDPLAG